jgi:hypothetical protein
MESDKTCEKTINDIRYAASIKKQNQKPGTNGTGTAKKAGVAKSSKPVNLSSNGKISSNGNGNGKSKGVALTLDEMDVADSEFVEY